MPIRKLSTFMKMLRNQNYKIHNTHPAGNYIFKVNNETLEQVVKYVHNQQ